MDIPFTEIEHSRDDLHRMPHSHRHATPSAPWSWTDFDDGMFIVTTQEDVSQSHPCVYEIHRS